MPKKIEVYECEYCKKKVLRTKSGMKQHEKKCFWNPETKSCMTCENFLNGGHYPTRCYYKIMNIVSEYSDSKHYENIKKLQTKCKLYKPDGLTIEERKQLVNELNSEAQSDWDEFNYSRM